MNYAQAESWVQSFTNYEKTPGVPYTLASYDLRRMDELLAPLGDPQYSARTVHITGTKGKGSTAAMIAAALTAAGYRTGLYTSPHLITLRERIRVGSRLILPSEFSAIATGLKPFVEKVNLRRTYGELTTFEILTAIAFVYFRQQKLDYQVLEVGLGGRLDATNVARPEVCVLTSISLDHTEALGNTVAKIATEKSGIIKPGCAVVTSPQQPEALAVIEEAGRRNGAAVIEAGRDVTWELKSVDTRGQALVIYGRAGDYPVRIPLLGAFQLENAAVAVAVLEELVARGARIAPADIARGFAAVRWPGRLQVLARSPWLVADGAHNAYSTAKLAQALRETFQYDRLTIICGMSGDKDIPGIVGELAKLDAKFIATRADHPRAAAPQKIAAEFGRYGKRARVSKSVAGAIEMALRKAGARDLACVTGSLFVVGEAIRFAGTMRGARAGAARRG